MGHSSHEKDEIKQTVLKLEVFRSKVKNSSLFEQLLTIVHSLPDIAKIWCLALGSPTSSRDALYQLAFIQELSHFCDISPELIIFYDPIFNDQDRLLLENQKHRIEEKPDFKATDNLLYLPHASLELTEQLFKTYSPRYLLANDLVSHTERLAKVQLHEKYPTLSTLIALIPKEETERAQNYFFNVVSKKKKNRKHKNVYSEATISYDFNNCYAKRLEITKFSSLEGEWGNAFSDMAFHIVEPK